MSQSSPAAGERPRLRGRDPREAPRYRPIADSNVPLYVPASTKPVRVRHAHAQRLFYYFALPMGVFALMVGISLWVYTVITRNSPHKRGASITMPGRSWGEVPSAAAEPAGPEITRVQSVEVANGACELVRRFMEEDSLEKKVAWTTDPDGVRAMFINRFEATKAREIPIRDLSCEKQYEQDDRIYLVVNATLDDFSKRDYIVQSSGPEGRLVISDPAALLP